MGSTTGTLPHRSSFPGRSVMTACFLNPLDNHWLPGSIPSSLFPSTIIRSISGNVSTSPYAAGRLPESLLFDRISRLRLFDDHCGGKNPSNSFPDRSNPSSVGTFITSTDSCPLSPRLARLT